MKKLIIFLSLYFISFISFGQSKTEISIIPEPVSIVKNAGYFVLPKNINVVIPADADSKETSNILKERLAGATGYAVTINNKAAASSPIQLTLNKTPDNTLGAEGYSLSVTPKSI